MSHRAFFVVIGLGAALLAGCTPPTTSDARPAGVAQTGTPESGISPKSRPALQKGMLAAQVRDFWGKPAEIKPFKVQNQDAEIWVYQRSAGQTVQEVQTGTRDVISADPMTGLPRTNKEPIYEKEFLAVTETIELLMFHDRLVEWKRSIAEKRTYY